ncbi:expansin EXLX1 family cellulose-binding protein [Parafrankia sp. FMc2]|uniref:expansin EXLX1 family cellulose-binding protein n=1 Tax=Parafrankia sp. FMc2 TaxID=3233196 RepID=UPI0034D65B8C
MSPFRGAATTRSRRRRIAPCVVITAAAAAVITGCLPSTGGGSGGSGAPPTRTATTAPTTTPTGGPGSPGTQPPAPGPGPTPTSGTSSPATSPAGNPATRPPVTPGGGPGTTPAGPQATAPATPPSATLVPVAAGRIRPGVVYRGPATHYGATGGGNCMFDPLSDPAMPVVAMNETDYETARACGAYIEVTGPGGSTVVRVTDRCPECPPGHVDLSEPAFARIAGGVPGRVDVTWRLVSPASIGAVQYRVKEGSSAYWLALQVRQHRNPIASLEVQVNGVWKPLQREMWNYFVAPQGLGAGPFTVRITDIHGERLVHTVALSPGVTQQLTGQFAQR